MGAGSSCPKNFEQGVVFSCRHTCPDRFKYAQETEPSGPLRESCVSMYSNDIKFELRSFPMPRPNGPEPPEFQAERTRVAQEAKAASEKAASQQPVYDALLDARAQHAGPAQAVTQIRAEYARYAEHYENPKSIKDIVTTLKPLRPPTAPASDLAQERKAILESSAPNFLLIQVELAILVLCLLVYTFLSPEVAPALTVLLLSVGAAVGIFLRK